MTQLMNLKESTKELIEELVNDSYFDEDIYKFIEEYGENNFVSYYQEYVDLSEKYSYEAVDAFVSEFGVSYIESFEESYYGTSETPEDFVEEHLDSLGVVIPELIVVDWSKTWSHNFSPDFIFSDGFVFLKNF